MSNYTRQTHTKSSASYRLQVIGKLAIWRRLGLPYTAEEVSEASLFARSILLENELGYDEVEEEIFVVTY